MRATILHLQTISFTNARAYGLAQAHDLYCGGINAFLRHSPRVRDRLV